MNQKVALLEIAKQLIGIAISDMQRSELNIVDILVKAGVCVKDKDADQIDLTGRWELMNDNIKASRNEMMNDNIKASRNEKLG